MRRVVGVRQIAASKRIPTVNARAAWQRLISGGTTSGNPWQCSPMPSAAPSSAQPFTAAGVCLGPAQAQGRARATSPSNNGPARAAIGSRSEVLQVDVTLTDIASETTTTIGVMELGYCMYMCVTVCYERQTVRDYLSRVFVETNNDLCDKNRDTSRWLLS